MSLSHTLTRRTALLGAAAVPLATQSFAAANLMRPSSGLHSRVKLGEMDVTTLLDGARTVDNPHGIFGLNVSDEEFEKAATQNLIPVEQAKFFFTPTVVNNGKELVLFDTGNGGDRGNIGNALSDAGYTVEQIDIVVLTHMHPDHIGGLMTGGAPTFPNARYVAGQIELDFWRGKDNRVGQLVKSNVIPLLDRMSFVKDGEEIATGITAMAAFGHTPGHMVYMLENSGQQMLLGADFANHYVWSLAYPDWEVRFDMDKSAAAQTRRRLLDMLSNDKIPFVGYHMPFPAVGYVETRGGGFHYVPSSYQLIL